MKIYKTQKEVEKDIKNGMLVVNESVEFKCSINIDASLKIAGDIKAWDINAKDINARDINARDINAKDINAKDINARDINAKDIKAWDINAKDIKAWDINAKDINAWDINAKDINARDINAKKISYYAFCCVYNSIKCFSIRGTREKCAKPLVIDGEINIKEAEK